MVPRRKPSKIVPITERIEVVPYGTGFERMVRRMGADKFEELRQQTLKDQEAARAKWGAQKVGTERDRDSYQEYPKPKMGRKEFANLKAFVAGKPQPHKKAPTFTGQPDGVPKKSKRRKK